MKTSPYMRRTVMLPLNGGLSGLVEKRLYAANSAAFSDTATQTGNKNKSLTDTMLLDDEPSLHINNAEDPSSSTITFSSEAGMNIEKALSVEDADILSQYVHVAVDGVAGGQPIRYDLTANETINIGQPVYVSSANTVNLADADTLNTSHVLGIAITDATANTTVTVLSDGSVERADWTAITGSANLVAGAVYYLSTTAGGLTVTPPTGDGDNIVRCGIAVSTTKFDIEINEVAIL